MNKKMFFAQNITRTVAGLGYGYLYNWYAVSHVNFAPSGWHVPTNTEFNTLATYLGGLTVAGGKIKETGITHWLSPNTGATNISGFTALPGGFRLSSDGSFSDNIGGQGVYWSSSSIDSTFSYHISLFNTSEKLTISSGSIGTGQSIRLIKDSTTLSDGETSTMTDYDGNVYDTICIGTQEWIVQNWKCTKLNDGTALTKVTSDATWAAAGAGDYYYCAYDNDESNV